MNTPNSPLVPVKAFVKMPAGGTDYREPTTQPTEEELLGEVVLAANRLHLADQLIEAAWGLIANVGWHHQAEDWNETAIKWRAKYHEQWLDLARNSGVENQAALIVSDVTEEIPGGTVRTVHYEE